MIIFQEEKIESVLVAFIILWNVIFFSLNFFLILRFFLELSRDLLTYIVYPFVFSLRWMLFFSLFCRIQHELEVTTKQPIFVDSSISDTIRTCIVLGNHRAAMKVRTEFKVGMAASLLSTGAPIFSYLNIMRLHVAQMTQDRTYLTSPFWFSNYQLPSLLTSLLSASYTIDILNFCGTVSGIWKEMVLAESFCTGYHKRLGCAWEVFKGEATTDWLAYWLFSFLKFKGQGKVRKLSAIDQHKIQCNVCLLISWH